MKKIYSYVIFILLFLLIIPVSNVKANNKYIIAEGVIKFNKNVYVQPEEVENSDVISIGGDIYVSGTVNGNVISIGGNIYLNGKVSGNATAIGGRVIKSPNGIVRGTIKEKFKEVKIPFININENIGNIKYHYNKLASAILLFILCAIVCRLIPYNEMRMTAAIDNELWKSLIYGYCFIIFIFMLFIILLFSIIGIIFIPIVAIAVFVIFIMGFTSICLYIGKRFLKSKMSPTISIAVGVAFYELIKSVIFLNLGHIFNMLFIFPLSVGIPIMSKFGSFRPWRMANTTDDWNDFWKH
ncbi:polymer-forming cytoskeletal protein [Clostridium tepidum]|uniref:Polymer-forming cytoskeletal protein n=1 Tax=Clostridium tepidum TaxID=1962263 RepID=A0A1S9I5X2_9CLOT|nr:polymer-forming cytoskeletal protein [Clostridium tepidum]MCR1934301.1 polymer-forming cytoskeletal protein [Clostridium tepidum]MDU6877967.1 polymer-forming cytoskeletal protein [Clostridium botulinum]OOO62284.1 hypothetical protein BS637_07405 [Clostridium tepidum]OOO65734.1 hypothetical protein BS638_08120 [Clostridium tepidum]